MLNIGVILVLSLFIGFKIWVIYSIIQGANWVDLSFIQCYGISVIYNFITFFSLQKETSELVLRPKIEESEDNQ
jgi:uncharacterized protein with PQ loop repeat